jgi:outer membrane protein OmpA-like peptidoglycan-associated protein
VRRVVAAALVLGLTGCPGGAIRRQTGATDGLIVTARDHGAQKCAPVELAMAESNNDFATHDLDEGSYYDARRHARIAETNAKLAIEKSPKDKCAPGAPAPKPTPTDRDGDGILDAKDQCPDEPEDFDGWQDEDGCPEPDNDADGVLDATDQCPNDPEDRDGFEDEDGCAELDNDKDGLNDSIDQCPSEAEDRDNFEDDDGCPDPDNDKDGFLDADDKCPIEPGIAPDGCPKKYVNVVVTDKKIEIKQTVYFDTNKAKIKKVSFALLDEVAEALEDNPKIKIEVQGHTDSQGNDKFNLKLSQSRANSVRAYLIKAGVAPDRMTAKGYGENVMIADNRTAEGRAQNRRVEFVITAR